MVITLITKEKGGAGARELTITSNLPLSAATEVSLAQNSGDIAGLIKQGEDLHVQMESGETLDVQDFFVVGPDGDFSRLLTESGEVVVTGLMGPEPDMEGDSGFIERFLQHGEDATAGDPASGEGADPSADEDGGRDWMSPALLAGVGFSLGSGIGFLSENNAADEGAARAAKGEASPTPEEDSVALAHEINALTGDASDVVSEQDYDPENGISSDDLQGAAPAPDVPPEMVEVQANGSIIDTGLPALSMQSMDETTNDILSVLMTEDH